MLVSLIFDLAFAFLVGNSIRAVLLKLILKDRPKHDFIFFNLKILIIFIIATQFEDKVAIKEFFKAPDQGFSNTFYIYYILSYFFVQMGVSIRACFMLISVLVFWFYSVILYKWMKRYGCFNSAVFLYLLANFYPDFLYFGLFSLRDLSIAGLSAIIFYCVFSDEKNSYIMVFVCSFLLVGLRPELFLWLLLVFSLKFVSCFNKESRWFLFIFCSTLFFFLLKFILFFSVEYIGWKTEGFLSTSEMIRHFMDLRYERQFSDSDASGGTTPTLPPQLYYSLDLISLVFLQGLSFVYISLSASNPFFIVSVITGIPFLLFYLRYLLVLCQSFFYPFLAAIFSFQIYVFFLVNGGNAFRLRLSFFAITLVLYGMIRIRYYKNESSNFNSGFDIVCDSKKM